MHTTIDYAKSPAPKSDAVNDIKEWFGQAKWDELSPLMSKITDVRVFTIYAELGGVQGFPVRAWYDLYHGEGAYDKALAQVETEQ